MWNDKEATGVENYFFEKMLQVKERKYIT